MKKHSFLPLMAVGAVALTMPSAPLYQGLIHADECSLNISEIMNLVGDDNDPTDIFGIPSARLCTPEETYTIWVREYKIFMKMDQGEIGIDYENADNPSLTLYNPRNDTHTKVTAEKIKEMRNQMMGGRQGGQDLGGIMDRIRGAAGVEASKVEGPYRSKHTVDCADGTRWAAHQGTIGAGNPMEPKWHVDYCITDKYPDLTKAFQTLAMAANPFGMEEEDAKGKMEKDIATRGFPTEIRELSQGGGLTGGGSLTFEWRRFRVEPGDVRPAQVNAAKGTEEPDLMKFMMAFGGGMQ